MYTVAVRREFTAQHFLIGGDWGPENKLHSHPYQVELQLQGARLDQHGYLVDIDAIEKMLDQLLERYRDKTLNDLSEFNGLNPSIENFARILCQALSAHLKAGNITQVTIKIWESNIAWASYQVERNPLDPRREKRV